jgi:DNA-binding CsgD family transcriptional regulator
MSLECPTPSPAAARICADAGRAADARFSAVERACLAQMAAGRSRTEAAHELGLSKPMVDYHMRRAREKAGARTREHLIALWTAAQIILGGTP